MATWAFDYGWQKRTSSPPAMIFLQIDIPLIRRGNTGPRRTRNLSVSLVLVLLSVSVTDICLSLFFFLISLSQLQNVQNQDQQQNYHKSLH